ncbi:M43 family zinc metalloprotease [Tenacibaculum sp.]|nr:M43 family zinc metalloprotease [Tenacibaculum sp.]
MKFLLFVLCVLAISSTTIVAQQHQSCQFKGINNEYLEKNPVERSRMEIFEKQVIKRKLLKGKSSAQQKVGPYIIPVVFHIYDAKYSDNPRTGEKRSITDERVIQSLASINADFKGFNDPVDNSFSNIEGGMNIEFRLAQVDPNGNTTTGIIYHERKEGFGLQTNDEEIAKYAWDNYKYMNVHIQEIVNSGSDTDSGIAWFPYKNMSDAGTARVVYNGKYMIYAPPASSLTHEFGHWLGLHHTFNGGCVSGADKGDLVADTPPTTSGAATGAGSVCNTGVRNCFGALINHQNHMDYNPCESMFTKGQVTRMESFMTHDARKTLWTAENLTATGTNQKDIGARVIFTFQKSDDNAVDQALAFIEGFANNNGSILSKKRIKAVSGAKFAVTGDMQEGVHYTTTGVPNGLSTKITVEDNENARITFTGNAISHNKSDSREVTITLLNPAMVGGVGTLYSKTGRYDINFIDPYTPYYETYSPTIIAGRSTHNYIGAISSEFNSLVIGGQFRTRVRNYNGNTIGLDNNSMDFEILCNPGTINVKNLNEGTTVSASTSGIWVGKQEAHLSPPVVTGPGYSAWNGKTGYAAIRIPTITGGHVYGWLRMKVNSTGDYAELTTFGLNPDVGKSIQAKVAVPNLVYSSDRFLESESNDGTIGNEITVDLEDATFSASGVLEFGTHYSITNVPEGLRFVARVANSRQLKLSMVGVAKDSDWGQYNGFVKDIRVQFKNSVFANGAGSQVEFKEFPLNVEYIGDAFSKEVNPINRYVSGSTPKNGGWIVMLANTYSLENTAFGYMFQDYNDNQNLPAGDQLISFGREIVANSKYEVTPLNAGTVIGPNSAWQSAREFHEERGQHMLDSDEYRVWRGRTNYVGFRIQRSGRMHYGWFKLRVGSGGSTCEILEFGIQGIPGASIKAGSIDSDDVKRYCDAKGSNGTEGITNVEFAGIDNSSSRDASGYADFTGNVGFIAQGKSYPLKVNVVGWNGGSAARVYAWFDWNNDKDFRDSGESYVLTKTTNTLGEVTVNVPANAKLGVTRMRLRVDDRVSNLDCGDTSRGEVEDYQVKIGVANATCGDGEQNGDETGIDCGGSSCEVCPTCDDGIKNGDETEVDCGGNFCEPCEEFTAHCEATATGTGDGIDIVKVEFGTINKSSTGDNQYTDNSTVSTNLTRGSQVELTVTTKNTWDPTTVGVWIDWNNDNDFRDDEERVLFLQKAFGSGPYSGTVTVPTFAVGNTELRMRVRSGYTNELLKPCGTITSIGEVEDYRVTVGGIPPVDTQVPTGPSNLVASSIGTTTLTLNWGASTDNIGVTEYDVYRGTTKLTTVTGTSYNVVGLTANTSYTFSVKAKDAAGNTSVSSNIVNATTTQVLDNQSPTAPSNLQASNVANTTLTLNWGASTDNTGVAGYDLYRGTTKLTTVTATSYNISGLTAGTTYAFSVKAKDAAGNESTVSNTVNVTTTGGPNLNYCEMKGSNNNDDYITNVNFGGINNTSAKATGGYHDYTLPGNTSGSVSTNGSANLKVTLIGWSGGGNNEVYAWFDWNKDGDFTDAGEKFEITTKTTNTIRELAINVPGTAATGITRMRIVLGYNAGDGNSSCGSVDYGEVEDYDINIAGGVQVDAPVAQFTASSTSITVGSSVNFTDQSMNTPTAWSWTFTGGTPTTSTLRKPSVTYSTAGTYEVALTATNAGGSDSETKTGYITVTNVTVPVNAGSVSTNDNKTAVTTITGDGIADIITFAKTGNSNDSYIYLITDDTGKILTTENTSHNFEGTSVGICRVYGIAYKGTLSVTNKNVTDTTLASGAFDVTNNFITVTREAPVTNPGDAGVVYVNMTDVTISSSNVWKPFELEKGDGDKRLYGWHTGGSLKMLYNTNKPLVANGTTGNVTFISEGATVGASNNYKGDTQLNLSSSTFTDWHGKSGYVGFNFKISGAIHYGWVYITVSSDGGSVTFKDYAYHSETGKSLVTKRPTTFSSKSSIGRTEVESEFVTNAYPNPFNENVTINVSSLGKREFTLSVYNVLGKEVLHKEYKENPGKIVLGEELKTSGNYFVKIRTSEKEEILSVVKIQE